MIKIIDFIYEVCKYMIIIMKVVVYIIFINSGILK